VGPRAGIETDNKQAQAFVPPSAGMAVEASSLALPKATPEEHLVFATALASGVASSVADTAVELHLASGHAKQEADSTAAYTDVAAAWAHPLASMASLFPHLSLSASPH
jgi:hypothetical protein